MTDIGVGDVVEAVDQDTWYFTKGTRTIVAAVLNVTPGYRPCGICKTTQRFGFLFTTLPLPSPDGIWCPNHWRKVGGREETLAMFREDLNVGAPAEPVFV